MTTTVGDTCAQLRAALAILSTQESSEILRRKDVVKLVLSPLFDASPSPHDSDDDSGDDADAIFVAQFEVDTGITSISSVDHPSRMNFRMHKITKRKLERFVRKLDTYAEFEVEADVFVIADRGNLYIHHESNECWRMDPSSLIRAMEESADYNSL